MVWPRRRPIDEIGITITLIGAQLRHTVLPGELSLGSEIVGAERSRYEIGLSRWVERSYCTSTL